MRERIPVIGAGKTGRGFLARLIQQGGYEPAFLDRNAGLVKRLATTAAYRIEFSGGDRASLQVEGYGAEPVPSPAAAELLARSRWAFASVGARNLPELAQFLVSALLDHPKAAPAGGTTVFLCENAVDPAGKLRAVLVMEAGARWPKLVSRLRIVECAVFCSTIEKGDGSLDICSESYGPLPFDALAAAGEFPKLPGLEPVADFGLLLERKIFTYNSASAAIAYLGAFKGYQNYAEAANDPEIARVLRRLYLETGRALCAEHGFDSADQAAFAERSLVKFSDRSICDSVERNARDAARKLAPDERLTGPAHLMERHGVAPLALSVVAAAALLYDAPGERAPALVEQVGVMDALRQLCGVNPGSAYARAVARCHALLLHQRIAGERSLAPILEVIES